jgi:DNA-binding transcriptional MocR family regulator
MNSGNLLMGGGANPLVASLVADYCQKGLWEPHIEYLCDLYRRRCDAMLAALAAYMPPEVSWTLPSGGFFIWLTLPKPVNAQELGVQAKAAGVLIAPGHTFFAEDDQQTRHIRLSFSYANLEAIPTGIAYLATVLKAILK